MGVSLFMAGLLLYFNEKNSISELEPKQTLFACTLSDYPAEKANSYMLTIKLKSRISNDGA